MGLNGCAITNVKQRSGVDEAKSCMAHRNTVLPDYPDYIIQSCTNTGVWIVEKMDPVSRVMLARYDFVNQEYNGPETGGAPLDIAALGGMQESDFKKLQKGLNQALLK
jgi:hypothetical protein